MNSLGGLMLQTKKKNVLRIRCKSCKVLYTLSSNAGQEVKKNDVCPKCTWRLK